MWDVDREYPAVPGRWGLVAESSPTLGDAAEEWLTWLAAARAPKTGPVYRTPLRLFVAHIGSASSLAALTPGQVAAWIATLCAGRRRNSVCMYVSAIRSFLKWAWRMGYTVRDVGSYIESPRREESARWPVPTAGVRALLAAAATPVERALVLVLYGCGLRVSEAVGLRWSDIDLEGRRALIRGKGSKQRHVGLGEVVAEALGNLRESKRPFPYTYRWAEKVIDRLAARAGLGHVTPHQLRHSFADALVGDDVPILQLKDLMGHSSLATTLQYLRARDKQRAVEALRKRNPADRLGA